MRRIAYQMDFGAMVPPVDRVGQHFRTGCEVGADDLAFGDLNVKVQGAIFESLQTDDALVAIRNGKESLGRVRIWLPAARVPEGIPTAVSGRLDYRHEVGAK